MPPIRFTSLLGVEERLLEAKYFACRLRRQQDSTLLRFHLNAFLSAARSVTFLLQKELGAVAGFPSWWNTQRLALRRDAAARYFMELRNFSQKEGRVSLVGCSVPRGKGNAWTFRFAGNKEKVPAQLLNRDVADCCHEHVAKLATVVLECVQTFPHQCCPRLALTPDGVKALAISLSDIEETLGFPRGWSEIGDPISPERRLLVLREHFDGLDLEAIKGLSRWTPRRVGESSSPSAVLSKRLLSTMVDRLERPVAEINLAELAASVLDQDP